MLGGLCLLRRLKLRLKLNRFFFGGYTANYVRLAEMGYVIAKLKTPLITIQNIDQGFGQIKGQTQKVGAAHPIVPVCVFKRSTRQLLWETKSKPDGTYAFRNIAVGLECFVVAFDPNEEYNAVISDKVVAK